MIPVISAVVGVVNTIAGIGKDYLHGKRILKQTEIEGKVKIQVAKVEAQCAAIKSAQEHNQNWEIIALKMTERSYKDEWVLGLLSVPLILAFTPWAYLVTDGFESLQDVPFWYQASVGAAFALSLGIRSLANIFTGKAKK